MKTSKIRGSNAGVVLMMSLLCAIGIAGTISAQAQNPNDVYVQERERNSNRNPSERGRNWERYGSYGGSTELRQTALNAGYQEGLTEGRQNRESGRRVNLQGKGTYQTATIGYNPRLGNRALYQRYFREAFEDAYNSELSAADSYERDKTWDKERSGNQDRRNRYRDGYANLGGSFQLRQTALNAGFNEGTRQGRVDLHKGNSNGFHQQSAYRKATKDYSTRLGDREVYQRYYREAYEHGYNEGFGGF